MAEKREQSIHTNTHSYVYSTECGASKQRSALSKSMKTGGTV